MLVYHIEWVCEKRGTLGCSKLIYVDNPWLHWDSDLQIVDSPHLCIDVSLQEGTLKFDKDCNGLICSIVHIYILYICICVCVWVCVRVRVCEFKKWAEFWGMA